MTRLVPTATLLMLAACSNYGFEGDSDEIAGATDSGDLSEPTEGGADAAVDTWRIDVFPAFGTRVGGRDILPHSFATTVGGTDHDLVLSPGVRVEGVATAYHVGPLATSTLPGSDAPVPGTLSLRIDESVQGRTVALGADGAFAFDVVPAASYRLVVTPTDPTTTLYVADVSLGEDLVLDLDLGVGSTLWGRVLDDDGQPMAGVDVRAVGASGPTTGTFTTGADGTWLLRVPEGVWTVEALGRGNGRDPKIESPPLLVESDGVAVDLQYANLTSYLVSGRMVSGAGPGVRDGVARFTSVTLDGYDDTASLVVEVPADDFGNFDTRLVAGRWMVDLFPQDDQALTPQHLGEIVVSEPIDLGVTSLSVAGEVTGLVLDPAGGLVAGALVDCVEESFGHRTWTLRSDDLGTFAGPLPRVPVRCDLVPPGDRTDLAMTPFAFDPAEDDTFELTFASGILVEGQARYDDEGALRPLELALVEVRDAKGQLLGTALTHAGNGRFAMRVVPAE